MKTVDISAIKTDSAFQGRAGISKDKVKEYRERMDAGDIFPPLDVFHFEVVLWLVVLREVEGSDLFHAFIRAITKSALFYHCSQNSIE